MVSEQLERATDTRDLSPGQCRILSSEEIEEPL